MAFNTAIAKVIKKISEVPGIGTSVTYRKVSAGSYNSTSGEIRASSSDTTVKAVFEDVNLREVNDLVQADDRKCTIPADSLTFTPSTADQVVINSVTHQIIRVKIIDQAGVNISYELYLRA